MTLKITFCLLLALTLPILAKAETASAPLPPVAGAKPKTLTLHDHERVDSWYWLNERENPEVIAYLEAENEYTHQMMSGIESLQEELYEEIIARLDPTDESVPYELDGYWYYTRYTPGGDYRLYCRKESALDAPEEIMLDGNALGEDQSYFAIAGAAVSSDQQMIAYGIDTVGRRKYSVHFKDLETGEVLERRIDNVSGNLVWAEDSRVLFYTRQDPETLRSYQIWRHEVGTQKPDVLVFEETDDTFSIDVSKSKSREYLMIESEQTLATEYRILRADEPFGEWQVFEPREIDHEYQLDHVSGRFLIRTNWEASNFRLMETTGIGREQWTDLVPHREDTFLETFEGFDEFLVIRERRGGLQHLVVMPNSGESYEIEFSDPTYATFMGKNLEASTTTLRYVYTSMTTPTSTYDFDMATRTQELMKRDLVLGDFDPEDYESKYLWATARDGARVPVSIVYRKDQLDRGNNPLLLYSYGSYGSSSRATFNASRLSLLDRGFVWATAHIRGGQELGRQWYEDGKLLHKKNTFTDFIDCGRYLSGEKWCDEDRIYGYGGSAGGLLIGAAVNMAPELFDGAVARVPFVDVVTTMLDESIPLTTSEWDEWGDPREKIYYDYMLSYSPYDQVEAKDYPNLLVTAGLHDSQVQYFEPAKWVAKLRSMKTDDNLLLLYTNMEAGHGGASGRLSRQKETALVWSFVLDLAASATMP
jgi:oligopeptidase B